MKFKTVMVFENYSEEALTQVVEQAIDKPFLDQDGKQIGTIVKVTRVDRTKNVEFEIDTEVM